MNGIGTDLREIMNTIDNHHILQSLDAKGRFWDMFVVDALIGNPDRNNGNWGVVINVNGGISLSPVYDNGNCLNNKWPESIMESLLSGSEKDLQANAYKRRVNLFTIKGKRVHPYKMIQDKKGEDLNQAVLRIVPRIDMNKINAIIDDVPCLGDVSKQFYKRIIQIRYESVLLPTYEQLMNIQRNAEIEEEYEGR